MTDPELPAGWERWNEEPGGPVVLVFRPDVFDAAAFPPACLPTIYVSRSRDPRRGPRPRRGDPWTVELRLEPAVIVRDRQVPDRQRAIEAAQDLAAAFAAGEIEYRDAYEVPRDAYLDQLDELIGGRGPPTDDEPSEREA